MHVAVVSIGPVQEFIASARKCRDLWFGSWLLSELCRAAAQEIERREERPEADILVFPGAKTDDRSRSVANKIVARLARDPAPVMASAEAAMRQRLAQIRDAAFALVGRRHPQRERLFRIGTARQQVDELIEFQWASAPEQGSYAEARTEAERLLAAVKATKPWVSG